MRKQLGLVGICFIALMAAFVAGRSVGIHVSDQKHEQLRAALDGLNTVGYYGVLADTAKDLRAGRKDKAQCTIEVTASAYYDRLRECLASVSCQHFVDGEIRKSAPELIAKDVSLPFRYYRSGEACSHTNSASR